MISYAIRATAVLTLSAFALHAQEQPAQEQPAQEQPAPEQPAPEQPVPKQHTSTVLIQPTGSSYTFGAGASALTVEQLAIPLAFIFPFHRRFTVDLTTAAAYTRVVADDSTVSEIYGGTDTQIRANLQLLMDHLVLTLGINAPSGQYFVDDDQRAAAGLIGNDFLFYPISSMGSGPAGTAGIAMAVQLLHWNLGVGGSVRRSMDFVALGSGSTALHYEPADETLMRLSAERQLWLGTASLGITFSQFGDDLFDSTTYSTGDRVMTTAGWSIPIRNASVVLGLWNLKRDAGQQFGGNAPREGIRNWSGALNLPVKRWTFQPSVETRRWESGGKLAGELRNYGISIAIPVGTSTIIQPRFGSSSGTLYSSTDASTVAITGWQGSVLIRRR